MVASSGISGFANCAGQLSFRSDSISDRDHTPVTDMATALPTGGFNAGLSVEPSCAVATVSVRELTVSGELSRNEGAVVILIGSG